MMPRLQAPLSQQLPAALRDKVIAYTDGDAFGLRVRAVFVISQDQTIECFLNPDGTIPSETLAELCLRV